MTETPKRRRGRPPKPGGTLAELDSLLQKADPMLMARGRALFGDGATNDLLPNPAQAAEALSRDRAQMLKQARPARSRKAPEAERARMLARAERLDALRPLILERPGKSASNIAQSLQKNGLFLGVAPDTLRRDIAQLKKLAGSVK